MKLFEFAQRFPDEASCESYLKAQREKSGIVCKKCGCRKNYWDSHNKCWRCSKCGHETTLTADTVMRDSKYTLLGSVEVDEGFFSTKISDKRYKFNRRYFGDKLFDRLMIASVACTSEFEHRIYNRNLSAGCG